MKSVLRCAFYEERRQEEERLSKQALEDFQRREKEKAANPTAVVQDRPFQLGGVIKNPDVAEIRSIVEEESSIILEGFVFASEIKILKSGRALLEFKVTDYTDSLLIKMFSRNDDDVPMMEQLKKGMWVRVRGSVQWDNFARDQGNELFDLF